MFTFDECKESLYEKVATYFETSEDFEMVESAAVLHLQTINSNIVTYPKEVLLITVSAVINYLIMNTISDIEEIEKEDLTELYNEVIDDLTIFTYFNWSDMKAMFDDTANKYFERNPKSIKTYLTSSMSIANAQGAERIEDKSILLPAIVRIIDYQLLSAVSGIERDHRMKVKQAYTASLGWIKKMIPAPFSSGSIEGLHNVDL